MILFPNAKINLGLNIVRKRPDGYHDIETVFYPIPLCDVLEMVESQDDNSTLTTHGRVIDCEPERNLVMKAYRKLCGIFEVPPMDIYLEKIIPDGAGLGGGSSDASSVLMMINEMCNLNQPNEKLAQIASELGADCPFFIYNKPLLATGIGNVFEPICVSLAGKTLLLIKPAVHVPTALAYSKVTPRESSVSLQEVLAQPISEWKNRLKNDFENSVFAEFPSLLHIKEQLYEGGAQYASMSGSGSSLYGIFDSVNMAERIKENFKDCETFVMKL